LITTHYIVTKSSIVSDYTGNTTVNTTATANFWPKDTNESDSVQRVRSTLAEEDWIHSESWPSRGINYSLEQCISGLLN